MNKKARRVNHKHRKRRERIKAKLGPLKAQKTPKPEKPRAAVRK